MTITQNLDEQGTQPADRLPLARLLAVMVGVYTFQSTVGALMFQGVPTMLRSSGVALDMIGLVSLLMLPWTVKFLWSPWIERWRLAPSGARRSRPLILGGQSLMILLLAALALVTPAEDVLWLFAGLGAIALVAATVDIASDGHMIDQLEPKQRGWGNVAQVGGGYAGIMIGTGLFLVLLDRQGWQTAILVMAAAGVLLVMPCLFLSESPGDREVQIAHRPSLSFALRRPTLRWGLLIVLLGQLGLRLTQGMTGPFMIDKGMTAAQLGLLTGTLGTVLCLGCVLLVGLPLRRWGPRPVFFALLIAQGVMFALFCLTAAGNPSYELLATALLVKSAVIAMSFVALYTLAMDWTSPHQAGVDFTLVQCADALVSVLAGLSGGVIAQHLGYEACFALAALFTVLAVISLAPILKRIERSRIHDR